MLQLEARWSITQITALLTYIHLALCCTSTILALRAFQYLLNSNTIQTIPWMAPELLSSEQKYGPSIDVYSFGILMWETLALEMPFRGIQPDEITERVCQKNERPSEKYII